MRFQRRERKRKKGNDASAPMRATKEKRRGCGHPLGNKKKREEKSWVVPTSFLAKDGNREERGGIAAMLYAGRGERKGGACRDIACGLTHSSPQEVRGGGKKGERNSIASP